MYHFWRSYSSYFSSQYHKHKCTERHKIKYLNIGLDILCLLFSLKFVHFLFMWQQKKPCKLQKVVLKHNVFSSAQISIRNQLWNPGRTLCREHTVLWLVLKKSSSSSQKWDHLHKSSAQLLPHSLLIMSYRSENPLL